jgi:hypothetical protein
MRAGMPVDQDEARGCPTVFAADEALWVVAVLVVHLEGAGHVRPPGSAGALAGRVSQGVIKRDFPCVGLDRQAWFDTSFDGPARVSPDEDRGVPTCTPDAEAFLTTGWRGSILTSDA